MSETYFKAVRPDGTDFWAGTVQWLPEPGQPIPDGGIIVTHPTAKRWRKGADADAYLSVSTVPTACTGMKWPCRLAVVERFRGYGVHAPEPERLPHKRAAVRWLVVEEAAAHLTLGPHGAEVAAIIERARRLTADEATRLGAAGDAAWSAARGATWSAAWSAARGAAGDAAWSAARGAAGDAARGATWDAAWSAARGATWSAAWSAARSAAGGATWGALVRDLISDADYDTLVGPWRSVLGDPSEVTA